MLKPISLLLILFMLIGCGQKSDADFSKLGNSANKESNEGGDVVSKNEEPDEKKDRVENEAVVKNKLNRTNKSNEIGKNNGISSRESERDDVSEHNLNSNSENKENNLSFSYREYKAVDNSFEGDDIIEGIEELGLKEVNFNINNPEDLSRFYDINYDPLLESAKNEDIVNFINKNMAEYYDMIELINKEFVNFRIETYKEFSEYSSDLVKRFGELNSYYEIYCINEELYEENSLRCETYDSQKESITEVYDGLVSMLDSHIEKLNIDEIVQLRRYKDQLDRIIRNRIAQQAD